MPYGTPSYNESDPTFSLSVQGANSETVIDISITFRALDAQNMAVGFLAPDVEALFQHLVDHMAALPEFPGTAEGIELTLSALETKQAYIGTDVTPTETP